MKLEYGKIVRKDLGEEKGWNRRRARLQKGIGNG
jgi:hypothetical protein